MKDYFVDLVGSLIGCFFVFFSVQESLPDGSIVVFGLPLSLCICVFLYKKVPR